MSWFELDKEADFRVFMTDVSMLIKTKKTLLAGAETCKAGGGEASDECGGTAEAELHLKAL